MSTLNFYYEKYVRTSGGVDIYESFGSGVLTYTITTLEDSVKCVLSQIKITNDADKRASYSYSVSFGGSTIASDSVTLSSGASTTKSLSVSKSVARGHSSSMTSLAVSGSGGGGSANNKVLVTVGVKISYTVSYYANGGSNAPSAQTKWWGESLTLSSSKPYRNGYVFYHWNTSSSNTGTSYAPSASYTENKTLNLYAIWNPTITYNANAANVSSLPANATKTYGVTYTIPSTVPTRSRYQFMYWTTNADGTGMTYQAGASYTSDVAVTLYAQWLKVADPPTILSIKAVRCDANGVANDTGTYCYVEVRWSVDTTSAGMTTNEGVLTGNITPSIDGSTAYTFYEGDSGTSGTAKALIGNCDTDTTYTVSVTVTNSVVGTGMSTALATTAADILSTANFTMDFRRGGKAIGIGSAAPSEGLKIGWDTQCDKDVNISGDVIANNLKLASITDSNRIITYLSTGTTCTSATAYIFGPICFLQLNFTFESTMNAGSQTRFASIAEEFRPKASVYGATPYGLITISPSSSSVITADFNVELYRHRMFPVCIAYVLKSATIPA